MQNLIWSQHTPNSNPITTVKGMLGCEHNWKREDHYPASMPKCHLHPELTKIMRRLSYHLQPRDKAPNLLPAGAHHTGTFIWKTWKSQGGVLHTYWAETPLTAGMQAHVCCSFVRLFLDRITWMCICLATGKGHCNLNNLNRNTQES